MLDNYQIVSSSYGFENYHIGLKRVYVNSTIGPRVSLVASFTPYFSFIISVSYVNIKRVNVTPEHVIEKRQAMGFYVAWN